MSGEPWSEFSFRFEGRLERAYSLEEACQMIADGRLTADTMITVYEAAGPISLAAADHLPIQLALFPDGSKSVALPHNPVAPGAADAQAVDVERLREARRELAALIAGRTSAVDLAKPRIASIAHPEPAPVRAATADTVTAGPRPERNPAKYASVPLILLAVYRFADFRGRSSRGEYWAFMLGFALCSAIVAILISADNALAPYAALGLAVLLIPGLAVTVRRLNDFSVPGWVLVLVVAVMLIYSPWFGGFALLALTLLPGSDESNANGQPPVA